MTPPEFKELILNGSHRHLLDDHIFGGEPHIFRRRRTDYGAMREHLSNALGAPTTDIVMVGSAKTGFSMAPESYGRRFREQSDVDVIIVAQNLFDSVWKNIVHWNYPQRSLLMGDDWAWCRRRRTEIYWGYFYPPDISFTGLTFPTVLKPVRDFTSAWFNAFQSLSLVSDLLAPHDVTGRLYRTWDHAYLYHLYGLQQLKSKLVRRLK